MAPETRRGADGRLFEALRLRIRYDHTAHTATCVGSLAADVLPGLHGSL
jgi:hypothetical protein